MTQNTHTIQVLLDLHHALWDMEPVVDYFDEEYETYTPEHKGFTRVLVPGKSGNKIMFVTQNLNKSSYGTMEIQEAAKRGKIVRITWIVDPSEGQFKYIGLIKTRPNYVLIEKYTSFGTQVLYSTDPYFKPVKSAY